MHIEAETLDDLLGTVFRRLLRSRGRTNSSKGPAREIAPALLTLKNPRARFSRTEKRATLFSCLGETLWYLSGSDSVATIEHYIPNYRQFADLPADATTDQGAYGPRLFGGSPSQIQNVIAIIKNKLDTRQAVAQIFEAADVRTPIPNVPCTCTLQFFPRNGVLHMLTSMRSNDAYRGLPHDVFAFTLVQELVARSTNHEVGLYNHSVGSLRLYDDCEKHAREFMAEGVQDQLAMPPMPSGDPWSSVRWLLQAEALLRSPCPDLPLHSTIEPYWVDLARLLRIRQLLAKGQLREVIKEKQAMRSQAYYGFIRGKEKDAVDRLEQMSLPGIPTPEKAKK